MAGRGWTSIFQGRAGGSKRPQGADPDNPAIRIPFDLWLDTAIIVALEVNHLPVTAMLDSGATISLIDARLAKRLSLEGVDRSLNVQTPTGATRARAAERVDLSIEGRTLCTTRAAVYDFEPMSQAYGEAVELVLGRDFFEAFVLEFDFANRAILATPQASFDSSALPPSLSLGRGARSERSVEVSICGRAPVSAILDLGSSIPLMLSADYASAERLLEGSATSTAATGTIDGISVSTTVTLDAIAIGDLLFAGVPAEVYETWQSAEFAASIGFPVLARAGLVLDFGGDRVWLLDERRLKRDDFPKDRSGLGLAFKVDGLVVVHVARGGPAEETGWRDGETIVAINGHSIDAAFRTSDLARWRQSPAGSRFALEMGDGSVRELTLKDHY